MRSTWLLPICSLLFGAVTAQVTTKVDDLDDPRFIGYYIGPDQTERLTATTDWVTSGSFAGDCPNDPCTLATNCVGNVLTFNNGQTAKCGSGSSCVTMSIFQSFPNGRPLVSNIFCRGGWQAYTVYRQLAAETTSSSEEETSKPTGTTSTTSSAEATSDPQNDGDDDSNDEDPLEDGEETSSGGSNAWIAGAVIGPLAAVCAAVAAFVWMRKRKGAQQSARAGALEDGSAPKDGPEPPPVYMLHTNEKPIELPTEQQFVAELPASTRY